MGKKVKATDRIQLTNGDRMTLGEALERGFLRVGFGEHRGRGSTVVMHYFAREQPGNGRSGDVSWEIGETLYRSRAGLGVSVGKRENNPVEQKAALTTTQKWWLGGGLAAIGLGLTALLWPKKAAAAEPAATPAPTIPAPKDAYADSEGRSHMVVWVYSLGPLSPPNGLAEALDDYIARLLAENNNNIATRTFGGDGWEKALLWPAPDKGGSTSVIMEGGIPAVFPLTSIIDAATAPNAGQAGKMMVVGVTRRPHGAPWGI